MRPSTLERRVGDARRRVRAVHVQKRLPVGDPHDREPLGPHRRHASVGASATATAGSVGPPRSIGPASASITGRTSDAISASSSVRSNRAPVVHPPANQRGIGGRQRRVPLGRHRVFVRPRKEDAPEQLARLQPARGDHGAVMASLGDALRGVQAQIAFHFCRAVARHALLFEHRCDQVCVKEDAIRRAACQAGPGTGARRTAKEPLQHWRCVLGQIAFAVRQCRAKVSRRQHQSHGRGQQHRLETTALASRRISSSERQRGCHGHGNAEPLVPQEAVAGIASAVAKQPSGRCRGNGRHCAEGQHQSRPAIRRVALRVEARSAAPRSGGARAASSSSAIGKCTRSGWNRPANCARSVTPAGL